MKTIIILAAAAMTGLTVTAVNAESVKVSYADLDTSSAAGRATLDRRVHAAANVVCGVASDQIDLAGRMEVNKCRTAAIKSAMQTFAEKTTSQYASR